MVWSEPGAGMPRDTAGEGGLLEGGPGDPALRDFIARVWVHYDAHARHDLPWRRTTDPYRVLVSEVMLQQTQVPRVVPKYEEFLREFPTAEALAAARVADVVRVWSGLGYNRRALGLKRAAEAIVAEHGGRVPGTLEGLTALPGVGRATAGQVLAFAFGVGVPFIETNIRSVYLHEFFADAEGVPDAAILPLVEATIDHERSREWFWALLDYGTHLKATRENPSRRSRHHVKQGRFEGSTRQLRGRVLRALADGTAHTADALAAEVRFEPDRVQTALEALQAEGFVSRSAGGWRLG